MSKKHIQDAYPLSPMQEGMLFHSLFSSDSGDYFEQFFCVLSGSLRVEAFHQAWQQVVDRHTVLRTAFVWESGKQPIQVVGQSATLSLDHQRWLDADPDEQQRRLSAFLQADRERGFPLGRAPLMRLALLQLAEDRYQFVWSFHHLVLDGWSYPLVLREVFALYAGLCRGESVQLPPPRPFREYIAWLQRQKADRAEQFWRGQLAGFSAPTPFQVDRASGPEEASGHGAAQIALTPGATAALQSFARQHQIPLNTLIQGAWGLLLSRYSGETDVVFGVTMAGRPADLPGVEAMVGMFINTLPMRLRAAPDTALLPWLKQILAQNAAMTQYGYAPLVQIQGWSDIPRGAPLFESIVVFENYPLGPELAGLPGQLTLGEVGVFEHSNYPLALVAIPGAELTLTISYSQHRFDQATVARMLGHLRTLLEGMLAGPAQTLGGLELLAASEREHLLNNWSAGPAVETTAHCLHELFAQQAARSPDAPALVCEGVRLTYHELNTRANRWAHELRGRGVGPETVVGMLCERSADAIVGLLGILKAGGVYLPLDPAYPDERIAFLLADARAPVVLTQSALAGRLAGQAVQTVCLDGGAADGAPAENPPVCVGGDNLAYMIYTSGSTGQPKGVGIPHSAAANHMQAARATFGLSAADRNLLFASLCFDVSLEQIMATLLSGACLVMRGRELWDVDELARQIADERLTVFNVPPAYWAQLVQRWQTEPPPFDPAQVRLVIVGGDVLQPEMVRQWQRLPVSGARLLNAYGPTETTITAAVYDVPPLGAEDQSRRLPIGRPLGGRSMYVLDPQLRPVPIGVPGELYIGGPLLARGYHGRPDLTAERFVPNPFGVGGAGGRGLPAGDQEPGSDNSTLNTQHSKLYKTGDLARWLPDGTIEFLGRADHQVKLRGFRIELGEIEAVLVQHPAVGAAVVVCEAPEPGAERQLIAYVVPADESTESGEPGADSAELNTHHTELKTFLRDRLPAYMVPPFIVTLGELPLNQSGKVDRRRLPPPAPAAAGAADAPAAPRSDIEQTLCAIWSLVLRREQIGIHDNFFDLGGDSILSIQVIARANQAGLRLTPKLLFSHPTVAGLAASVETAAAPPSVRDRASGELPLTPIQHWFFEQHFAEQQHFNQTFLFELPERADPAAWRQIVQAILGHHDALRLRFTAEAGAGRWQQRYAEPGGAIPFEHVDLAGLPPAQQQAAIEGRAGACQASLDPAGGPLLRVVLFDRGRDRSARLLLTIHHLAIDGVSWRVLLEDIQTAHAQLARGEPIALPPKSTSFKAWSERLSAYAQSAELREEADHWLAAGQPARSLPPDTPDGANREDQAKDLWVALSAEETRALLYDLPGIYHAQINDLLLSALLRAFLSRTGDPVLRLDLEGHGREDLFGIDISRTAGWFTTLFPVRLDAAGAHTPEEVLKTVKEQLRRIPNKGIGYGLLRYLCAERGLSDQLRAQPAADVCFNYLGQMDSALDTGTLRLAPESAGPDSSPRNRRPYALEINGLVRGGRLEVVWRYSPLLHRDATIEALAEAFAQGLRDLILRATAPGGAFFTPSDFPEAGLDQDELDELLAELA
ncbi:MAG TPA: amino acid adenylation domain-containing protein [Roseiflexaceae bacterium]|nr:amino acid adenylation domain-containing protein [Roseiflexaceae bacterium]